MYELNCKWGTAGGRQCGRTDPHAGSQYVVSDESSTGTCHPSKMCMYQLFFTIIVDVQTPVVLMKESFILLKQQSSCNFICRWNFVVCQH
jgi:hypothetical protein